MSTLPKLLHRCLQRGRALREWDNAQVAEHARKFCPTISRQTLDNWATMSRPPSNDVLSAVCAALGLDLEEFLLLGMSRRRGVPADVVVRYGATLRQIADNLERETLT